MPSSRMAPKRAWPSRSKTHSWVTGTLDAGELALVGVLAFEATKQTHIGGDAAGPGGVEGRLEDVIVGAGPADDFGAEALLEEIHAPQRLALFQHVRDAPHVVLCAAQRAAPL